MIETKSRLSPLYKVDRIVSGRAHYYTIGDDETWFPGVTTVLSAAVPKPALLPWALNSMGDNIREFFKTHDGGKFNVEELIKESKNIYKKKASEAADIGTRVHGAIDAIIQGESPVITPDIKPGVDGFLAWLEKHKMRIEFGDTKLASKLFGYGGSMDFLAFDGDDPIVFDVKTTKRRRDRDHGAYDEQALQLAAYCQGFRETYGLQPKAAYILWLNKENPEFKAVKVSNLDVCFKGFLSALELYRLSKYELFENSL